MNMVNLLKHGTSRTGLLSKTLLLVTIAMLVVQRTGAQNLLWATSFSGISVSALEEVEGVVADNSGNVFATGLSGAKGIGSAIRTMKLNPLHPLLQGAFRPPFAADYTPEGKRYEAALHRIVEAWQLVDLPALGAAS